MDTNTNNQSSGSLTIESTAISQFLPRIIEEATRGEATKLELSLKEEKALHLTFFKGEKLSSREFACSQAFWKSILTSVELKTIAEPTTLNTRATSASLPKTLRMKLKANTYACCTVERQKRMNTKEAVLLFKDIRTEKSDLQTLQKQQAEYNTNVLGQIIAAPKGIVLCNFDRERTPGKDALRTCYSLRPDARICYKARTAQDLTRVLELAEESLILLGVDSDDSVEAILQTGNLFRDEKEAIKRFYNLLVASFMSRSVRQSCKKCSKRTPISSEFITTLPPILQPDSDFEYMVGRGCEVCEHSAYQGWIDLQSALEINPELHKLLEHGASAAQISELASRSGARSLLEDGLTKVEQKVTTFEEVLGAVKRISSGFLAAAIHRSGRQDIENPIEAELREQLENLDNEYFFKETKAKAVKPKILLVEDNQDQLDILTMVLEKEGYEIQTATNGKEALHALKNDSTNLIVCDLMMPVMNGEDFVKELRNSPKGTHLPVLMLTAINDEDTEYNLLAAGADDYCSKGTKKKLILKRIEKLIHRTNNPLR